MDKKIFDFPKDEYVNEVKKIYGYICSVQEPSIDMLTEVINRIFVEAFGADVYDEDMEQCTLVAKRILSKSKA